MAEVRTRKKSGTHLSDYLGTGENMLVSELPTLRDVLRYGILLRQNSEGDPRNYQVKDMAKELCNEVKIQWQKANALFISSLIISDKSISDKIIESWDIATNISLNRVKKDKKDKFELKLDRLFDILSCKCNISYCTNYGCTSDCSLEAHIKCVCPRDKKIPIKDIPFIKGQKEKLDGSDPIKWD